MAYGAGQIITSNDYLLMANQLNSVFGTGPGGASEGAFLNYGYGQSPTIPSVVAGNVITAAQWNNMFTVVTKCGLHQGTSTSGVPTSVTAGQTITASTLPTVVNNIVNNRLNAAAGQMTVTSGGSKLVSNYTGSWMNGGYHEFVIYFGTSNNARYFFNSGGQIRWSGNRSGGSANSQNTVWTNFLNNIGTVIFDHTRTTVTGIGTGNETGYYNLTSSYQQIYSASAVTGGTYVYGNDRLNIQVRSENSGETLRFRVNFEGDLDVIDGTTSSRVDERRATGQLTIPSPVYIHQHHFP